MKSLFDQLSKSNQDTVIPELPKSFSELQQIHFVTVSKTCNLIQNKRLTLFILGQMNKLRYRI
jgi:hypothetical protein